MPRLLTAFVLAAAVLGGSAPAVARKGPKPAPCSPGRYLFDGGPIASGGSGAGIELGGSVSIDGMCDPIAPKRMKTTGKGITQVLARWKHCTGLTGTVVLQGKILPGCSQFQGTLKAKKLKKSLDAARSRCGDGIVDPPAGEECDDGNAVAGDGCEPDCVATPPVTTTTAAPPTTVAPTTTTTVASDRVTTTSLRGPTTTTSTIAGTPTTTTSTTTTTTVPPKTVLALAMIANPDPVAPLGLVTYEMTATNRGPVDAVQAELRLTLPVGLYTCWPASDGAQFPTGCGAGRDVVWALGTIPVGTSRTVQLILQVANLASGTTVDTRARLDDAAHSPQATAEVTPVVQPGVPLTLGLTEGADPVASGAGLEYVLRFGNNGANALLNTQLTLTLPPGTTVLDAGGGSVAAGTVSWPVGALNAGQTGEQRVRVTVDDLGAADPLVRVARATIASGSTAARAAVLTQVQASALGLVMQATPDPVAQRGLLTYELTVTNRGVSDADQVVLRMPVPTGTYDCYGASDAATGQCSQGTDTVWSLGTLPAGTSRTVQAIVAPTVANGSIFLATARVEDGLGERSRAAVSTFVDGAAPLDLALTTDANPVASGASLEYTLRFGNTGANALLNTQLTLTLPPGTTVLDAGGGSVAAGTVSWALGALNAGQTGERRVRVTVDDLGAADPLVRAARAAIASGSTAARAAVLTQVQTSPLGLVMQATPDPVAQRGLLTYELTVTNRRASDADQVVLRMPVPTGTYDCYGASDDATGSCVQGSDIVWSLGTMPAGTSRTVHAIVAPNPGNGAIFLATARVEDASGARSRAAASTVVDGTAPVDLALTTDANPVVSGATLEYALRFGNNGANALLNTQLTLTLPPGTTVLDADGGTLSGDTITWPLGTLDVAQAGERRVRVSVDDLGAADPLVRVARAAISSGSIAARASAVTQVQATSLGLVIQATPDPVAVRGFLTYELTVTNRAAVPAVQVELRMPVPVGTYDCYGASDDATGTCRQGSDIVWALGTMPAASSRKVHFTVAPNVTTGSIFLATARVEDASGARARAATSTTVQTGPPLALALVESTDPVPTGATVVYALRFGNRGMSALLGTQLALVVPAGTTVLDGDGGTLSEGVITWNLGTLDPAENGERQVQLRVDDLGDDDPFVRVGRAVLASGAAAARASVATMVQASALGLEISATPDPVTQRGLLTYLLKVTNNGKADSVQAELRMFIPAGTYNCGAASDGGTYPTGCRQASDVFWGLGTLAPGDTRTVQVIMQPDALPSGSIYSTTARVEDAAGSRTFAGVSTVVIKP